MMRDKKGMLIENTRYMFSQIIQFKRIVVLLPILAGVTQVVVSLVAIWLPKRVLDLIGMDYIYFIEQIGIGAMALFGLSVLNAVFHNQMTGESQYFVYTHLMKKWEEKMMTLSYEQFTSPRGKINAEKARNVISGPNWGVVSYLESVSKMIENIGGFLAFSTIICLLHPVVLVVLLILFFIEMKYGIGIEEKKQGLKEERAEATRKMNYMAYDMRGMEEGKDIRMYGMAPWLQDIAKKVLQSKVEVEQKAARFELRKKILNIVLVSLRNGGVYTYLVWCYFNRQVSIGEFTLYFAAVTGLGNWLTKLTEGISYFIEVNHFVEDFRGFMEMEEKKRKVKHSTKEIKEPICFSWKDVSFSYDHAKEGGDIKSKEVLKHINLEIKAGEKLAIVGTNGAGKTTFVKLLCGQLKPKSGQILINGMDLAEFDSHDLCKLFSAVFQKSNVLPISIKENIALNVEEKMDEDKMMDCILKAGLEKKIMSLPDKWDTKLMKRVNEEGTELSGGELQRLLLARALYKEAPILILDEPTAALDPIAESAIYQKYNDYTKGKTALFISHRLASTRFCDRMIVLDQGEIVQVGTHEQLISQPGLYAQMFEAQSKYYKEEVVLGC